MNNRKIILLITPLLLLIISCKPVNIESKKVTDMKLETQIHTKKQTYLLGEPIELYFEVKNTTQKQYTFCFWQTPLEDSYTGNFLNISNTEENIKYIGLMVKRSAPTSLDYIKLKTGESKKGMVLINQGYAIERKGTYTISFHSVFDKLLQDSNTIEITIE